MKNLRKQRRGVVLLIVLSLLVLFVFIGVTFVVLAGIQQDVAKKHAQLEERRDDPVLEIDEALHVLLRGTKNPRSAVWQHDILQDLYGTDNYAGAYAPQGVRGIVGTNGAAVAADSNFIRLDVTMSSITTGNARLAGYYNGCVFTMITGEAAGFSTRVVQFYPGTTGVDQIYIEIPPDVPQSVAINPSGAFSNGTFLINGRPFNGTGAGYDPSTDDLNRVQTGVGPVALNPNYGRYVNAAGSPYVSVGGMDESWDIADYQNMFLAYVPLNPTSASQIIPSFHRPSLAQFWAANGGTAATRQYYTLRPHAWSPQFNGSNPGYSDIPGPGNRWDVDNDGDGITDSIWIDAGFPVKTDASGRMYKPMFAYMVVDLDSRINVNTAGNFAQLNAQNFQNGSSEPSAVDSQGNAAGVTGNITLPRGLGMGPADIVLSGVVGNDATTLMVGRYGPDYSPGVSGQDTLSNYYDVGVSPNYAGGLFSTYASPPDLSGQAVVFLGPNGHPQYRFAGNANEIVDDPYEINVLRPNGFDMPFTLSEMERVLRWHDADATSLPTRLLLAAPNSIGSSPVTRRSITTHSYHIPTPNTLAPPGIRSTSLSAAPMGIMATRLRLDTVAFPEAQIPVQLSAMLPFELAQNRPMDLNRLFGNGLDDNGNFIVDEPGEPGETYFGNVPDYANDDPLQGGLYARRIYARHLYCLMMFLVDKNYVHPPQGPALPPADQKELTARLIAQWAVNCADFRDADAIMTPFEYDINPFDGWNVDENIGTNDGPHRGLVWGCEHPDLVLTETLAFHDVRMADTEAGGKRLNADGMTEEDEDLDSVRIPQGSLFVEVKGTRNRNNPALPRELYNANGQLDLARLAPDNSPVWRIVVSSPTDPSISQRAVTAPDTISFDPVDMDLRSQVAQPLGPSAAESIDRIIWFATINPAGTPAGYADRTYYNRTGNTQLLPGNYAVVGPRPVTYMGRQRAAAAPPAYKIQLNAGGSPQVSASDSTGTTVNNGHTTAADIQPPTAIICSADAPAGWSNVAQTAPNGIGISVSEPLPQSANYYPEPTVQLAGFPTMDSYRDETANTGGRDEPLDKQNGAPLADEVPTQLNTGTTLDFKACFLQRLANPLLAYDPQLNPYITVDWSTIDLTVFNGEDEEPGTWAQPFEWNPDDPDPFGSAPEEKFGSRERGSNGNPATFWSPLTNAPSDSNASGADLYFDQEVSHSLGYLSSTLGVPMTGAYKGEPAAGPVPWISILDRPFISPHELLLVPASEPSRLTFEFTPATGNNPYDMTQYEGEFRHLLNFFNSNASNPTGSKGANFYRILEFVEVPSRFVGTRNYYNPAHFIDTIAGPAYPGYRTPFNFTSRFRDPGRVNINTIPDDGFAIWRSISRLPAAQSDAQWSAIVASRSTPSGQGTRFGGVFQSMNSGDMAPLASLKRTGIQAGLLREGPGGGPLLASSANEAYQSSSQNAYFRYQNINRISNLVGTHSNVYAVWVTVGYFAVNPQDPTQIMHEIGAETGDVERHRGFYMIDRSIPVAYEPGQNHNVRKCIVLERFLE